MKKKKIINKRKTKRLYLWFYVRDYEWFKTIAMTKNDDDDDKEEVREEDSREAHINSYFMRITYVGNYRKGS